MYVEMEESVRRQMLRAAMAAQHNKRAADAGSEDIWNVRTTDVDDKKCRRRYEVFRVSKLPQQYQHPALLFRRYSMSQSIS